jgi:hypothetical protein
VSVLGNAVGPVCRRAEELDITIQMCQYVGMHMCHSILESICMLLCECSCIIVWVHRFAVQGNAAGSVCKTAEV